MGLQRFPESQFKSQNYHCYGSIWTRGINFGSRVCSSYRSRYRSGVRFWNRWLYRWCLWYFLRNNCQRNRFILDCRVSMKFRCVRDKIAEWIWYTKSCHTYAAARCRRTQIQALLRRGKRSSSQSTSVHNACKFHHCKGSSTGGAWLLLKFCNSSDHVHLSLESISR